MRLRWSTRTTAQRTLPSVLATAAPSAAAGAAAGPAPLPPSSAGKRTGRSGSQPGTMRSAAACRRLPNSRRVASKTGTPSAAKSALRAVSLAQAAKRKARRCAQGATKGARRYEVVVSPSPLRPRTRACCGAGCTEAWSLSGQRLHKDPSHLPEVPFLDFPT